MGRVLDWLDARAPRGEDARLVYGAAVAVMAPMTWAALARVLERRVPWPFHAVILKPAFAGRALLDAGRRVECALQADDLPRARTELRSLVSRPTAELGSPLIAAAVIESLAENAVDSWFAPLLAHGLFGLGGAYGYRAANTADAMWGYRTQHYEHLGKAAARLDDALNFVPARVCAIILCACAGRDWRAAVSAWQEDGGTTSSPNAGHSMASLAGGLGIRLEKSGHYALNHSSPSPVAADIARARRVVSRAMWASAAVALSIRLWLHD